MVGRRDDWRMVAFETNCGEAVMVRRHECWMRSSLSQLEREIWEPPSFAGVGDGWSYVQLKDLNFSF